MIISSYQRNFQFNQNISINNTLLQKVNCLKFLGIIIDDHLSWKPHIRSVRNKLRPSTGLISQVSSFLPFKTLIKLYYALIHSRLNYCIESWGNALPTNILPLRKIQNKVLRTIFNKPSGSELMYKKAGILTLENLYKLRLGELAFLSFHQSPQPVAAYPTRSSALSLSLPPSVTQIGHRRVDYQSTSYWNDLPVYIRQIDNKNHFRLALRQHLISL